MIALVGYYEPWWIQILKAIVIFAVILQLLPVLIVGERKILGRFQHRYGPNRVGPFGFLQPIAEIVKFATKEPMQPKTAVGFLFAFAPVISIVTAVAAIAVIPFSNTVDIFGTEVCGRDCSLVTSLRMSASGCIRPNGPTRLGP